MKAEVEAEKNRTNASEPVMDAFELFHGDTDIVSLRSTLLFGLRGMAAYAYHALVLGKTSDEVTGWLYKGLSAIPENHTVDEWLGLVMELGQANLTSISAHRFRPFSPRMCWMC
jgi:hydroxylamine reductase